MIQESVTGMEKIEKIEKFDGKLDAGKRKTFRSSPDITNFYRFVEEHGLRREAKMILESFAERMFKKKSKKKKNVPLQ